MRTNFCSLFLVFCCSVISLQAQVSLPAFKNTLRPHPEPAVPGDAFNPPGSGISTDQAPACAEWTRTAAPDESLVLTGVNFSAYNGDEKGKDARFLVYGNSGLNKQVQIQRLDNDKAILTLGKALPAWSMYLLWPGNEKGWGSPIAINRTEAWWVGPDQASGGATVSVYGRNLAHSNGTSQSNVYIKPAGGAGRWATVTGVNPYKVDFTVPADLPEGDYEIWTHNGHGGSYGWSGPLTLHVTGASRFTQAQFNVKNFGAKGDGYSDDVEPIRQALAAASRTGNATVYFPAGTYMVSNTLEMAGKTRWLGEGQSNTVIKCAANFSAAALGLIFGNVKEAEITGMGFEGNGNFRGKLDKPVFLRGSSDLRISNARFSFPGYNLLDLHLCTRIFLSNTQLTGITSFLGNGSQLFIDHCDFKLTNQSDGMLYSWGGAAISITHSTCSDYNSNGAGDGWGKGRFFVGEGNWGSNRLTYLGNNTTTDLGVLPGEADQNSGEQLLWEGNITEWSGTAAASATTLTTSYTFPNANVRYAVIIKGKGLGQSRRIVSYTGTVLTLDEAWNVMPDETSVFSIGPFTDRIAVYGNYLDGKPASATSATHTASAGIEPYGGIFNFVADNNTLHELRQGISNWATQHSTGLDPNYFSLFANNAFIQCRWAIFIQPDINKPVGTGILGTVYRNNFIESTIETAIVHSSPSVSAALSDAVAYEHNTFKGVPSGFSALTGVDAPNGFASWNRSAENQLFYGNTFEQGGSGNKKAAIAITPKIALKDNSYPGFAQSYQDAFAEAVVEAPVHVMELAAEASGEAVQASLTLQNAGATEINWKASTKASWISLSAAGGTLASEQRDSTIVLKADPGELAAGTYTADIIVSARDQVRTYSVVLQVSIPKRQIDNTPPLAPSDLHTIHVGSTAVGLAWSKAADSAEIAGYNVYVNKEKKFYTQEARLEVTGLTAETAYSFAVKAVNHRGDLSVFSNDVSVQTEAFMTTGLKYRMYQGSWDALPDFDALVPVQSGYTANIDISVRPEGIDDNFGFVWEGYMYIPSAGTYEFETVSDDGSMFYFNSFYSGQATPLVNNNGLHASQSVTSTVWVPSAGFYPVAITFFEKYGYEGVQLYWAGPGFSRQLVPNAAFTQDSYTTRVRKMGSPAASAIAGDSMKISSVYPNPLQQLLYCSVFNPAGTGQVDLEIYDMAGKLSGKKTFYSIQAGYTTLQLDLQKEWQLKAGNYILNVYVNKAFHKSIQLMKL